MLVREKLTNLVETKDLGDALPARGVPRRSGASRPTRGWPRSRPSPGTQPPYGGYSSPCGHLMKTQPVQVVYGPGTFLNRAVAAVNTQILGAARPGQAGRVAGRDERLPARARQAPEQGAGAEGRHAAGSSSSSRRFSSSSSSTCNSGITGTPSDRRPAVHPADRVRPDPRGQPAQGAVLVPVPDRQLGADPGAAEVVAERRRSSARRSRGSARRSRCRSSARPTAAPTRSPASRSSTNDLASQITGSIVGPADRRAAGDGGDAAARVPQPTAAAAARDRARRRRDHVRRDVAARRVADDGVDRGAADPDRPRGRLRDPVPVARRGGPPAAVGRRAERATPSRARPAPARRRSPPPRSRPRPASSCCCSRRCRWCAASACCSSSGSRSRLRAR